MNIPYSSLVQTVDCTKVGFQSTQSFMYDLKCGKKGCEEKCGKVVPLFLHLGKTATQGMVLYTGSVSLLGEETEVVIEESSSVDFTEIEEELGFSLVLLSASLGFGKETLDFICKDIEAFGPLEVIAQRNN